MATADNLQDAFAGESQANRKYLAFAKKADRDWLAQVAKLHFKNTQKIGLVT